MIEQEDRIIKINIEDEMKSSYIDYSMSVIVSRALPEMASSLFTGAFFSECPNWGTHPINHIKNRPVLLGKFSVSITRTATRRFTAPWCV